MFTLTFKTDNGAFDPDIESEIARILERVASQVKNGVRHHGVSDANGNRVGEWAISE